MLASASLDTSEEMMAVASNRKRASLHNTILKKDKIRRFNQNRKCIMYFHNEDHASVYFAENYENTVFNKWPLRVSMIFHRYCALTSLGIIFSSNSMEKLFHRSIDRA